MILVTGGSGRLGSELKKLLPNDCFPSHSEADVTSLPHLFAYLSNHLPGDITTVIHAAAFTSPPKVENNPECAIQSNIIGTANVVSLCMAKNLRLIYVSTDYVFDGDPDHPSTDDTGVYREDDGLNPINRYAWSKLGGECAVRMMKENWAIIRCSMGPVPFPYDKAPIDQYTSRQPIPVIAEKIVKIAKSPFCGVIHIGGKRQTVYDYAKEISPDKEIGEMSIDNMPSNTPKDTSLNTGLWDFGFGGFDGKIN